MTFEIAMALLVVRSESSMSLIDKSFEETRINIPKAPAVGLLLERPVYSTYNKHTERDPIDFDAYKVCQISDGHYSIG